MATLNDRILKFKSDGKRIHNDFYDYSKIEYKNLKSKITIICPNHGEFIQIANDHISGHGCKICRSDSMRFSFDEFKKRAHVIHNNKFKYVEILDDFIKMICPEHGHIIQRTNAHLRGSGCYKCSGIKKLTTDQFIIAANTKHHNKYNYDITDYKTSLQKVEIDCPIHGIFEQTPNSHLSGCGCPKCKSSKGEIEIQLFLENNNIFFEQEKKFSECKNKRDLPFDFYLHDLNICIEYDGMQHFKPIDHFGGEKTLLNIQNNDRIKTKYCKDNNIQLIRISYKDFKNIDTILKGIFDGKI